MSPKTNNIIAGIDDATKCPCIGSIFIAGVAADTKTIRQWKRAGVKDSKLIARKKREKLAALIKETALAFSIQEVTPAMIDDKTPLNLNAWEMAVVLNITTALQQQNGAIAELYIDNWEVNEKLFWQRVTQITSFDFQQKPSFNFSFNKELFAALRIIAEHKADERYTIVGAASILAKTSSDAQYDEYKKIYGAFGSGSPADPATRLFVWQHRKNPPPIIRKSWNTYVTLSVLDDIQEDYFYKQAISKKQKKKAAQNSPQETLA